jgi:methylase of polypeptide subunit release factors
MRRNTLYENLNRLDFEPDSSASGLLFTDRDYSKDESVPFGEVLILHKAQELKARAVYFRRIEGRSSVPQLFIYDNSDQNLSDNELADIHKKLWSGGIVPLYYVFDHTEVKIFNCRKPVRIVGKTDEVKVDPLETLLLTSAVHAQYKKKYSAHLFLNGSFWERPDNKDEFKADHTSYNKLIDGLRSIRNKLINDQNKDICNKLLVLSIFVKYLEERKDSKGNRVLPSKYFEKYDEATCFCDILRKKKAIEFFEDLGADVNGKIFELNQQEKKELQQLDLATIADFLDAKIDNTQYVLWRLYDFNYLPVELISRIYEEFIPERKDIAYTPTHLVNFMVDECMPISSPKNNIRIIDVSCGSGVFLVAAFKRMVQWWQNEQYQKTGRIQTPPIRKLKSILTRQIHGVDLEPEAAKLSRFSLTIAVCDMLDPARMWDDLTQEKFVDLSSNIIGQDFFDFILESRIKFDLIIGNPPFNIPVEGKTEKEEYWRSVTNKVEIDFAVPDNNIALLFLQQAMKLLKKEALLSLVMPSGPLLYNNTITYRAHFFDKYNVPQIFDFSTLSQILFNRSSYPVSAIFAENKLPNNKEILHAVVKRTKVSKERLYFEIDKYDLYYVPKELAKTEQLIWKANYLGGGHLFHLLKRMKDMRSLKEYLEEKKQLHKWCYGEGYNYGNRSKKALHLTGQRMIPSTKFKSDEINDDDIKTESATLFEGIREHNERIFKAPHVLIKENTELPIAFRDDDLIFKHEIVGISAPDNQKQRQELIELRTNIIANKKLYKMLLLSRSGRAGISRSVSTILKSNLMDLPYPDDLKRIKLSNVEKIVCNDILDYGIEQIAKGEKSKACSIDATSNALKAFAKVFCISLNSIYKEKPKQFYPLDWVESTSFICFPFAYGNPDKPKKITQTKIKQIELGNLNSLLTNEQGNVLYKRIIKLYNRNMVFLIKPKTLRYWLKSIALRDASDVFADLVSSGY